MPGRWHRFRAARIMVAFLVTGPLVFSALYMWVMWDPTKKVHDMPVAVVNQDVAVTSDGKTIDAGAGVSANLIQSQALGFRAVDSADAAEGLRSGRFYFVINIPRDFSARLATLGAEADAPAMIDVTYNDNNTLMASNIGARAMESISAAVLRGVAETTVGSLLDGVDSLGQGLVRASDGAALLHNGTSQLASGADELATAMNGQLSPGVTSAADGGRQLSSGAAQLAEGMTSFSAGTDQLGAGAQQLSSGIDQLVGRIDPATLSTQLTQLRQVLNSTGLGEPARSGLDQVDELLTGLQQLQAGSQQLADQLSDPTSAYREGLSRLTEGSQTLASGAGELSAGLDQLDAGTAAAAAGAAQLSDGSKRLDHGAAQLDMGLSEGAAQVPASGDAQHRMTLAALLSTPVATTSSSLAVAQNAGPGAAPVLLIIVTGLLPVLICMCFRSSAVARSRMMTGPGAFLRRTLAVVLTNIVVMTVAVAGIWAYLTPSPNPASLTKVIVMIAAATLMNVTIAGVLFTLLGYVTGTLTSLAFFMLQLFSYGGVWMIETVPAPFQWLHVISPATYIQDGFVAGFNGTGGFVPAVTAVSAVIVVAGAANIALASSVSRRVRKPSPGRPVDLDASPVATA